MFLGGDNQTIGEKQKRVVETLWPLTGRDMGLRWQCRCGKTVYVKYRGRFYCRNCGRRITRPDVVLAGRADSFRECFEAAPENASPQLHEKSEPTNPSAMKTLRDRALIRVFYDLALRKAEVVGLDIEHFDPAAGTLSVPRGLRGRRFHLELPQETLDALARWIRERDAKTGPIFIALDNRARGRRMTVHGLFWILRRAVDDGAWSSR